MASFSGADTPSRSSIEQGDWVESGRQVSIGSSNENENDDEALARMLQRQFMQEHREMQTNDHLSDDMELARMMQREELARGGGGCRSTGSRAHASSRISRNNRDQRAETNLGAEENDDLALARRMQELEQMGMGRLNSNRNNSLMNSESAPIPPAGRSMDSSPAFDAPQETETARTESGSSSTARSTNASSRQDAVPTARLTLPPPALDTRASGAADPSRDHYNPPGIDFPNPEAPFKPSEAKKKKKKKRGILNTFLGNLNAEKQEKTLSASSNARSTDVPQRGLPRTASVRSPGPLPHSELISNEVQVSPGAQQSRKKTTALPSRAQKSSVCYACRKPASSFLIAVDKKYHKECFKCIGCHMVIDSSEPFAYMTDEHGEKHPLHRKCYAELYGVKCAVCKNSIPAGPDGKVSFVKHPFFDTEQMCPIHASNPGRRCTGCHRFEPVGEPFADLGDSDRCVCYSCCRTVVVDGRDAEPLWAKVIDFFEKRLELPIWPDMRQVPVLIVGVDALNDQMSNVGGAHGGSSQIMTRGLCLTEHQSGKRLKLPRLKFDRESQIFAACDAEENGFTYVQVPDANKINPDASVTAILCLSGLPRDLTASVLAHEATHAWIKLHPSFEIGSPIHPMVEEGVAQLVAMLFLNDGLAPASTEEFGDKGPSDEKLRQYFKFSIETDDNEIYGQGYRLAAKAYADIGIEALLSHIVLYKEFPLT